MPPTTRLSLDEHTDMGRALTTARDELARRAVQLANAYPKTVTGAGAARKLNTAIKAIDSARSDLDGALRLEHPDTYTTAAYTPPPSAPAVEPPPVVPPAGHPNVVTWSGPLNIF